MDEEVIKSVRRLRDALLGLHEKTARSATTMRESDPSSWSPHDALDVWSSIAEITEDTATVCMSLANELDRIGDYLDELKQALDEKG